MGTYSTTTVEELVRRCSAPGDIEAWQEFVCRFHRLIAKTVLRTAATFGDTTRETADDLIQETYLKLCADNYRILRGFEHRHVDAFNGYIQVIARNVVRDHFKSFFSSRRGGKAVVHISDDMVPASAQGDEGTQTSIERSLLFEQIRQVLPLCVPEIDRERNIRIFWLYFRTGLSARAIASLPGIHLETKGVESLIFRVKKELQNRLGNVGPRNIGPQAKSTEGVLPSQSF